MTSKKMLTTLTLLTILSTQPCFSSSIHFSDEVLAILERALAQEKNHLTEDELKAGIDNIVTIIEDNTAISNELTVAQLINDGMSFSITDTVGAAVYAHYLLSDDGANTVGGYDAFANRTDGFHDCAFGFAALQNNTSGFNNSAVGAQAMQDNILGGENVAVGSVAMQSNTTGYYNTAVGASSLYANTVGQENTAVGFGSLATENGFNHTAVGSRSLGNLTSGTDNIGIGRYAGWNLNNNESYNIYIGNQGAGNENNTIRLGNTSTHTACYIAGNTTVLGNLTNRGPASIIGSLEALGGATLNGPILFSNLNKASSGTTPLLITKAGKICTSTSSRRYKNDIENMGDTSAALLQLRPVKFTYKTDNEKRTQFGLIAEEVEKTMPELVIYNEDNTPESVAYHALPPLLLNEIIHQHNRLALQETHIKSQANRMSLLEEELAALRAHISAIEDK